MILYDQLGCGRSDRRDDNGLWRIERFVDELHQVRAALGLTRAHILGHSWGAMLALDYALFGATGLASLILASPPLSIPRWIEDAQRLRATLPADVQEVLTRHEAADIIESDEYQTDTREYYRLYVRRLDPVPEALQRSVEGLNVAVSEVMWGPNESFVTGTPAGYERIDRLAEIGAPVFFTLGRYDKATRRRPPGIRASCPERR